MKKNVNCVPRLYYLILYVKEKKFTMRTRDIVNIIDVKKPTYVI